MTEKFIGMQKRDFIFNNLMAVDWAKGDKLVFCFRDDNGKFKRLIWKGDFLTFLEAPENAGCDVVIESTFESFDKQKRNAEVAAAEKNGIRIFTVNPRATFNFRRAHGIKKSDFNDAICLYRIATETNKQLRRASRLSLAIRDHSENDVIIKYKYDQYPEAITQQYARFLPEPSAVPADLKIAVLDHGDYHWFAIKLAITAEAVLQAGGGRDQFDRRVGAYEHGYPGPLRSDLFFYVNTNLEKKLMDVKALSRPTGEFNAEGKPIRERFTLAERPYHREVMRLTRRASRWVFYQVKVRFNGGVPLSDTAPAQLAFEPEEQLEEVGV